MIQSIACGTLVITKEGFRPVEDILVGDIIYDRNGKETKVTHVGESFNKPLYRITCTDGSTLDVSEDHLNIVQRRTQNRKHENYWKEHVLTTKEIVDGGVVYNRKITSHTPKGYECKWYIPLISNAIEFPEREMIIEPYTLGALLGDGNFDPTTGMATISGHENDLPEILSHFPYKYQTVFRDKRNPHTLSTRVLGLGKLVKWYLGTPKHVDKYIPNDILFGSKVQRIACLQGLMDTDGTISPSGNYSFCSVSEALAKGVQHIIKSLGGFASVSRFENGYLGGYRVHTNLRDINPFRLKRKANLWQPNKDFKSGDRVGIVSIELIELKNCRCLEVDSDTQSFITENIFVTHSNTIE